MAELNSLHDCKVVVENASENLDPMLYPLYTLKVKKIDDNVKVFINIPDSQKSKSWHNITTILEYQSKSLIYKDLNTFKDLPTTNAKIGDTWKVTDNFNYNGINYPSDTLVFFDGTSWVPVIGATEILNHKVTNISSSSTDDQYASAKAVYDASNIHLVKMNSSIAKIDPNKFYVWGEINSIDVTLNEPVDNQILNKYMFQFDSGTNATTLKLPSTVKWSSSDLEILPNKTYLITIINNLVEMKQFG